MDNVLTPSTASNCMRRAIEVQRPMFVWGAPGIGKSNIVQAIGKILGRRTYTPELIKRLTQKGTLPKGVKVGDNVLADNDPAVGKCHVIDLRLALLEPTDLRGYPYYNKSTNTMEWAHLGDLPSEELAAKYEHIILFLDELNSAPPSVQSAAYQLVLDRGVGTYSLPENVSMIAAGNRENDRGVTHKMPTPLADRFRHIAMKHDFDDWFAWGVDKNIHPDVLGFLSYSPQSLMTFNPGQPTAELVFATPRSWTYVSELLQHPEYVNGSVPRTEQIAEIAGAIGDGIASKFLAHRKIAGKLPNMMDIMEGKIKELDQATFDKQQSAKYSLIVELAFRLQEVHPDVDTKKFNKYINNVMRFVFNSVDPEMVVFFLKNVLKTNEEGGSLFNLRTALEGDLKKQFHSRYLKYLKNVPDDTNS